MHVYNFLYRTSRDISWTRKLLYHERIRILLQLYLGIFEQLLPAFYSCVLLVASISFALLLNTCSSKDVPIFYSCMLIPPSVIPTLIGVCFLRVTEMLRAESEALLREARDAAVNALKLDAWSCDSSAGTMRWSKKTFARKTVAVKLGLLMHLEKGASVVYTQQVIDKSINFSFMIQSAIPVVLRPGA